MATRRFRKNRRQRKTNRRNHRYRGGAPFTEVDDQAPHTAGYVVMGSNAQLNAFVIQNGQGFADASWEEGKMIQSTRIPRVRALVYKNPHSYGGYYLEGPREILAEISRDSERGLLTIPNYVCNPAKQGPGLGR
jgi:hypothetical protein